MTSNFWQHYKRAGHIEVSDAEGNPVRLDLCYQQNGRLGVVFEAPAGSQQPGRLTADFGPTRLGFESVAAATDYAEKRIY